jgi:putative component of toxin-antitoxin plasmid stabilization module
MRVEHYLNSDGRDLIERWLDGIRDRRALVSIERRIARIEGAGYRVYYAQADQVVVLLLCGGDKSTQDADVNRAVKCWDDFQRRRKEGNV